MNGNSDPQIFRDRDREASPVSRFTQAEDVLEAMLQSVQGGELHLRPTLAADECNPLLNFMEVGHALRRCLEAKERREYLLRRLRPHLSVIIGTLPASLLQQGLLPRLSGEQQTALG